MSIIVPKCTECVHYKYNKDEDKEYCKYHKDNIPEDIIWCKTKCEHYKTE